MKRQAPGIPFLPYAHPKQGAHTRSDVPAAMTERLYTLFATLPVKKEKEHTTLKIFNIKMIL